MARNYPKTKKYESRQDHPTPWEFMYALEKRFGLITWDMAAQPWNAKAINFITPEQNSLVQPWSRLTRGQIGYLNPEFDPVTPWVRKCYEESRKGWRGLLLTKMSMDSNWFWSYIWPVAAVYALTPRIQFVGSEDPYPAPLILSTFNLPYREKFSRWRWK